MSASLLLNYGFALPPWPEWQDAEVNTERWDAGPSSKGRPQRPSESRYTSSSFEDPLGHGNIPQSLRVSSWGRMFGTSGLTMCPEEILRPPTMDLAVPNVHLLHSDIVRWVLSSIMNLLQLSSTKSLPPEMESPGFVPTPGREWRPWHHVYSVCKAGKGVAHKPQVNPHGKYFVRLYYMGTWRRISVDDYMPYDKNEQPLLPTVQSNHLWPMILTKALLRVASLTWRADAEVVDFNPVVCLTGWDVHQTDCREIPPIHVWWLCQKLLSWDIEDEDSRYQGSTSAEATDPYQQLRKRFGRRTPSYNSLDLDSVMERFGTVILFGVLTHQPNQPGAVEDMSQCLEYPVLISEAKTFPIPSEVNRPQTPLWKLFRWKEWAIKKGIVPEHRVCFVNSIRLFSSMKQIIVPKNRTSMAISVQSKPEPETVTPDKEIKSNEEKKGQNGKKKKDEDKSKVSLGGEKKNVKEDKGKKEKGRTATVEDEGPKFKECEDWLHFDTVAPYIKNLEIFYIPSSFKYCVKLPEVNPVVGDPAEKTTLSQKSLHSKKSSSSAGSAPKPSAVSQRRTGDVFYLMVDSVNSKKLYLSLCVLPQSTYNHCVRMLRSTSLPDNVHTSAYHIMGERYNWKSSTYGKIQVSLKTIGTRSCMAQFGVGLSCLRVWLKAPDNYFLRIYSQCPFVFGSRDKIHEFLCHSTASYIFFGQQISNAFALLGSVDHLSEQHINAYDAFRKSYIPQHLFKYSYKRGYKVISDINSRVEDTLLNFLLERTTDLETIFDTVSLWQTLFLQPQFGKTYLERIMNSMPKSQMEIWRKSLTRSQSIAGSDEISVDSRRNSESKKTVTVVSSFHEIDEHPTVKLEYEEDAIEFVRRLVIDEPDLLKLYPFKQDDMLRMIYTEYKGIVRVGPQDFLPLVRFVITPHGADPLLCGVYFWASIPTVVIHVIDNDTLEEIPKFVDDPEPYYFAQNELGYTIFAYGLVDATKPKEVAWKLRLSTVPHRSIVHSCNWSTSGECIPLQPPTLSLQELRGFYVPQKDGVILRCLLTTAKTQNISFRVAMSNPEVQFKIRVKIRDDETIVEYLGFGQRVVPMLRLRGSEEIGPVFYVIEAEVLNRSWKLTAQEKSIMISIHDKVKQELRVFSEEDFGSAKTSTQTGGTRRSKKRTSQTVRPELMSIAASWTVLLVVDHDHEGGVLFEKDRRSEEKIRLLKIAWEDADPGRYKRGCNLRKAYLQRSRAASVLEVPMDRNSTTSFVPQLDTLLQEYTVPPVMDTQILTKEFKEKLDMERDNEMTKFSEQYAHHLRCQQLIISNHEKRVSLSGAYYEKQRQLSKMVMEESYDNRLKYIQNQILLAKEAEERVKLSKRINKSITKEAEKAEKKKKK